MLKLELDRQGTQGVLTLSGAWPPSRANELKEQLLEAMRQADRVTVHSDDLESASLPLFQLLLAARATSTARNREFTLAQPVSAVLAQGAAQLGMLAQLGVSAAPSEESVSKGSAQ